MSPLVTFAAAVILDGVLDVPFSVLGRGGIHLLIKFIVHERVRANTNSSLNPGMQSPRLMPICNLMRFSY